MDLIDAGNLMMLVEHGLGVDHAKVISDQWRAKCAELDLLKKHNDGVEAALHARTEELYPDLRAEIEQLKADRETYNGWAAEIKIGIDAIKGDNDRLRAALSSAADYLEAGFKNKLDPEAFGKALEVIGVALMDDQRGVKP